MKNGFIRKIGIKRLICALGIILFCVFLLYTALIRENRLSAASERLAKRFRDVPFSVCFLDVGQADCTLVRQGENVMLIDCGDPDDADTILQQLRKLRIEKIDVLVLSHPHSDHIGGADAILETLPVGKIYMPYVAAQGESFEALLDLILEKQIPAQAAFSGDTIPFGECEVTVLSPQKDLHSASLNAYSVVLLLQYGDFRFLFTADAETENEEYILESGLSPACDLVKIPHHGSASSSSPAFVRACGASYAIATTQHDSSNGLPKEDILALWEDSGAQVLCTMDCGCIYAYVSDGGLDVAYTGEPLLFY